VSRAKSGLHFWNGAQFLENLLAFRLLGIMGRLGGGKTSLAVAVARWLYENDYVDGIFSNVPVDPDFIPQLYTCRRAAVLLDEAAAFADSRLSQNKFEGYGAAFRKLDAYLISPSVYPMDKRMRMLQTKREIDLWVADAWVYQWINSDFDKGRMILTGYRNLFGRYAHEVFPSDDGGIKAVMFSEIKEISVATTRPYSFGSGQVWLPYGKS